nr:MAG TPA: hypothetical protein [Caudoviricetes sp.]
MNVNNSTSNSNNNIGTRLTLFQKYKIWNGSPCLLAKHKNS